MAVHDTEEKRWRHLNFFQHKAYITARVPRTRCPECGVHLVEVPWARPGSGFTLLFEASVVMLTKGMAVSAVAAHVQVHPDSVWRILRYYVEQEQAKTDMSGLHRLGMDEVSQLTGQDYVSTFCDMDRGVVVDVQKGRGRDCVLEFAKVLQAHGGEAAKVDVASLDMSGAFLSGVSEAFPNAEPVFDRFHVMKKANEAIDAVRRNEARYRPVLANSRWVWIKREEHLTDKQHEIFVRLKDMDLSTARAYPMKLALERVYEAHSAQEAETLLEEWIVWARRSRIRPMIQLARTLDRHFWGIVAFARTQLTNAMVEGLNTKIKADKRRAYGFRSFANYRTIILLVCGGLKLQPTRSCYEPAGTRPTGCRTTPSFGEALTVARCWPTS
jgi:transposase